MRGAILLVTIVLLVCFRPGAGAAAKQAPSRTQLSGGDLPHEILLNVADDDAFRRRLSPPPKLEQTPAYSGPAYTVTSDYWDDALRNGRDDRPPVEAAANYYPSSGHVRARQATSDVWIVLDFRQRAILDRYIRLVREGLLPETAPGVLEVLVASAKVEPIGIEIAGRRLTTGEAGAFWNSVQGLRPSASVTGPADLDAFKRDPNFAWVVFGLPEGRSMQMRYLPARDALITDIGGFESYGVPPNWLRAVVDDLTAAGNTPLSPAVPDIEQQEGHGSAIWWLAMIGAGVGLLSGAVFLKQRSGRAVPPHNDERP